MGRLIQGAVPLRASGIQGRSGLMWPDSHMTASFRLPIISGGGEK
jgi:hypothetical protein